MSAWQPEVALQQPFKNRNTNLDMDQNRKKNKVACSYSQSNGDSEEITLYKINRLSKREETIWARLSASKMQQKTAIQIWRE